MCPECGRRLVDRNTWAGYSPAQRAQAKELGWNETRGYGLCNACEVRLRKRGRLDEYDFARSTAPDARGTCTRCGVEEVRLVGEICVDCRDVVEDLGELEAWRPADA